MFITNAFAQDAAASAGMGGAFGGMLPLLAIIVIFYFFMLRPQLKAQKTHKDMLTALARGDQVLTTGGVYGKVSKILEDRVELEVANGTSIQVNKMAIASLVTRGVDEKVTALPTAKKSPTKKK